MEKELWLGELWDEWLTSEIKSQSLADLEVCGLLMGMRKNYTPSDVSDQSEFTTNRLKTARRLMKLWPVTSYYEKFKFTPAISLITCKNHKPSVKISCPRKILKFPSRTIKASWAWLKGIWGSAGSLYFPKNGYYLAIINSDPDTKKILARATKFTGLSWNEHKNEFTLRNHDDITTFLCNTGMNQSSLGWIEFSLIRSQRNKANIRSNYEAANIARSVKAASEQIIWAGKIFDGGKFDTLPENLKAVVKARLENPDDSLEELGKKLNPSISKSAVKYRWNKIQKYMEE